MRMRDAVPAGYAQHILAWQSQRLAQLLAPSGWLSVTGFGWLDPGAHRVGSGAGNDIVVEGGPAHLGVVTLAASGEVSIRLAAGVDATVDGEAVRAARLRDDGGGTPSIVGVGPLRLHVIARDGRKALRARDEGAAGRVRFSGLDHFAIDPAWRVVADWIPYATPRPLSLNRRLGSVSRVEVPGEARFRLLGRTHTLLPYREKPGADLFFVLADQTSGDDTYDKARFLYAAAPVDGQLVLDFNKAHNPPSAFTPYANCPVAPPENRLALRVTAGEKRYPGHRLA